MKITIEAPNFSVTYDDSKMEIPSTRNMSPSGFIKTKAGRGFVYRIIEDIIRARVYDTAQESYDALDPHLKPKPLDIVDDRHVFQPDHNGECLVCDEPEHDHKPKEPPLKLGKGPMREIPMDKDEAL